MSEEGSHSNQQTCQHYMWPWLRKLGQRR